MSIITVQISVPDGYYCEQCFNANTSYCPIFKQRLKFAAIEGNKTYYYKCAQCANLAYKNVTKKGQ